MFARKGENSTLKQITTAISFLFFFLFFLLVFTQTEAAAALFAFPAPLGWLSPRGLDLGSLHQSWWILKFPEDGSQQPEWCSELPAGASPASGVLQERNVKVRRERKKKKKEWCSFITCLFLATCMLVVSHIKVLTEFEILLLCYLQGPHV